MFLKLCEKSFLKCAPGYYSCSFFKNNTRNSLEINESAYNILSYCDGNYTKDDSISALCEKYSSSEEEIRNNVEPFLKQMINVDLIEFLGLPKPSNIKRGSSKIYFPDVIMWEITDFCPLDCKHCYLESKSNVVCDLKNIDKILNIIDISGTFQVQLTCGEALTHPHFEYILNNLIDRGIIVSISTSGMILNDSIVKCLCRLKEVAGSFVRVSLDGSEKSHNFIRNNDKSYQRAIQFIKEMVKNEIDCQIGTVITNQSEKEIEELVCLAKNLGVSLIEIGLIISVGNSIKNNIVSSVELYKYKEFLKMLSSKYSDENFAVKFPCESKQKNCGAGSKILTIKANVDIAPCPTANLVLGNLNQKSIKEIMKNGGQKFHELVSPCEELCHSCKEIENCKSCISQGLAQKREVKHCEWYSKQKLILDQFIK